MINIDGLTYISNIVLLTLCVYSIFVYFSNRYTYDYQIPLTYIGFDYGYP